MYKINCLNKISNVGLELLNDNYKIVEDGADAILVRSAAMHDLELENNVLSVARAGAGVNNIPLDKFAQQGVVVFNTPGANANGVKELVLCGMLISARDVLGGIDYVNENINDEQIAKSVEKAKASYAGYELFNKKVGIIGLGAIGVLVANMCVSLGMDVYGYDPYLSVDHAINLDSNVVVVKTLDEIYKDCDFITIHVPLVESTKKMINKDAIDLMKKNVVILNFARDLLVDEDYLITALENGLVAKYISDFPNPKTVGKKNIVCIPHLGASTVESEDNCAKMAVKQTMDYLENGNIVNSVNFPNVDAGLINTPYRITIAHKNVVNMISQFSTTLGENKINILNMINKSLNDYAYTIIDVDNMTLDLVKKLELIDGVFKARILSK